MQGIQRIYNIFYVLIVVISTMGCQPIVVGMKESKDENALYNSSRKLYGVSVEWVVQETFKMDESPLDVEVSQDGSWIFVLTDRGNVLVYSANGGLIDRISVGLDVTGIKVGPGDEALLLISPGNKTVRLIELEFIRHIDVFDSPFKGPAYAPVVIVVFSDFQ